MLVDAEDVDKESVSNPGSSSAACENTFLRKDLHIRKTTRAGMGGTRVTQAVRSASTRCRRPARHAVLQDPREQRFRPSASHDSTPATVVLGVGSYFPPRPRPIRLRRRI